MRAAAEAPTSTRHHEWRAHRARRSPARPADLFLRPHVGLHPAAPVLAMLAEGGRLIAQSHPGFGHSGRPAGITTVDDIVEMYASPKGSGAR